MNEAVAAPLFPNLRGWDTWDGSGYWRCSRLPRSEQARDGSTRRSAVRYADAVLKKSLSISREERSRWDIAGILRKDDIIRNRLAFGLFSHWHFRKPLQAGEYLFDRPLDSRETFGRSPTADIRTHRNRARGLDDVRYRQPTRSPGDLPASGTSWAAARKTSLNFGSGPRRPDSRGIPVSFHVSVQAAHQLSANRLDAWFDISEAHGK